MRMRFEAPIIICSCCLTVKIQHQEKLNRNQEKMEINHQTNKRSSLFLSSLSSKCSEDDLFKIFSTFGEIVSISIKNQISSCESLVFGFVHFLTIKSAVHAKNELNGTLLFGETLRYCDQISPP